MDNDISLTFDKPTGGRGRGPAPSQKPGSASDGEGESIYGVFSTEIVSTVGAGSTKRKETKRALWFAEEIDPEDGERTLRVRPLNNNNVPTGDGKAVALGDFLHEYSPELEYYQSVVYPKMKELDEMLTRAEKQRDKGAFYSAQFGFEEALEFDERNVRANFGLGLTYMARGDTDKAVDVFRSVVGLDAAFSPEHKHLFNEFGISLRKSKLFDQAVEYYGRALEITDDDENLYYNLARAHFERGDLDECRENLEKALELNPDLDSARQFLDYLDKRGSIPEGPPD
ncbi:MAG: tetratricopeptide repeat protein [Desulfovibrionaceae bacterium]|nr:tetratricopeptide repeat protein [Desulfovibrionaceae bacterium]